MQDKKSNPPSNWQFRLKDTSPGRAYQAVREAVRDAGSQFEVDYQRAKKVINEYRTGRTCKSRVSSRYVLADCLGGSAMDASHKRQPSKVVVWLIDPLVIELPIFVPPGNARIVPLDNPSGQSTSDQDNALGTLRPGPILTASSSQ